MSRLFIFVLFLLVLLMSAMMLLVSDRHTVYVEAKRLLDGMGRDEFNYCLRNGNDACAAEIWHRAEARNGGSGE